MPKADPELQTETARIAQAQEEVWRFTTQQHQLTEEALKRRRGCPPPHWLLTVVSLGATGGILAALQAVLRLAASCYLSAT